MSKLLLVAVTASVLLTTLLAEEATTSAANFKPRDDPFVIYEELKEALKKVNPQLLARVNEEEKNFKHDRDKFDAEAKDFADKVVVGYLEAAINSLKGQLPSQDDVYTVTGALRLEFKDLSMVARAQLDSSVFFKGLRLSR